MPDYSKGKVYRILQDNDKTVYIGSTTQPLSARMAQHRRDMNRHPGWKLYTLMAEVGVDRFSIELVADFPCERGEQLRAEEGRHIRENKTAEEGGNMRVAGRTYTESNDHYATTNKDAIATRKKAYDTANKDSIAACKKAYDNANKDATYARKKKYDDANKDAVAAHKKAWYQRKKAERAAAAAAAAEPVIA